MRASRDRFLQAVRRRLRWSWLAATVQSFAPFVLAAGALVLLVDRFVVVPRAWVLIAAGVVGAIVLGIAVALLLPVSVWDAARVAERGLGARDVLTTSLEFADPDDPFHAEVQRRAAEVVTASRPKDALPIRLDRRRLRQSVLVAAIALAMALVPPFGAVPALSVDDTAALAVEADEIERIAAAVEQAEVEGGDELADELRRLAEELRTAETLDEALALLDRAESRIEADLDPTFLSQKAAAQGLARDLTLRPLTAGAPVDAAGQFEHAADGLDSLTEQERRALADRLQALAASQSAGNPGLANELSAAASALSGGDLAAAAQALQAAAAQQRAGFGQARGQQALTETLRALDGAQVRLATQAAGNQGSGPGSGQGQGTGQGQGSGSGQGAGQGQGTGGTATGGGGSGTISGVRPGDGGAAGQGGVGAPGSGTAQSGDSEVRTVFDPTGLGTLSDRIQVGIAGGSGEGAVIGRGDAPTDRGDTIVPYTQVLPDYLADAADAISTLEMPPSLRSIVRTYFDRLAQQAG